MVDLAGSEKANNTKSSGLKILEGGKINQSLLALGNCINALVDKKGHIPWRNSKLTRILQDSIGGNSRLVLIANISPSVLSYQETLNTLTYANRAKNIKKEVTQNVVQDAKVLEKYENVLSKLNDEIEEAKGKLRERSDSNSFFTHQSIIFIKQIMNLLKKM